MSASWFVGVAEHRRDEIAEHELTARGFDVHIPRQWQRERTVRGKMKTTYDLLLSPYLYVKFDPAVPDEYSLVLRQRGLAHVLESRPEKPGSVPVTIIADHIQRERDERANLVCGKAKGRRDLVLMGFYVITRHELFRGQIGRLFAHSGGIAYLDCDKVRVTLPENDIAPVVPEQSSRSAA